MAVPRRPAAGAFQRAVARSRRAMAAMDVATVRELQASLRAYTRDLEAQIARFGKGGGGLTLARNLTRDAIRNLETEVINITARNRFVTFDRVRGIYQDMQNEIVAASGIKYAALGGVPIPDIAMLNAFDAIGSPKTWRTLQRIHLANGAREVAHVVRVGLAQGIDAEVLGRRLRFYVEGSQPFQKYFTKIKGPGGVLRTINIAQIPSHLRGQAQRMVRNARRIAVSEIHNARAEAEIQHSIRDPLVRAIQWQLAPDRGSQVTPDQCDFLASANFYGLGRGMFPVGRVPSSPHPNDRCERFPITRSPKDMKKAKPDPNLVRDPASVRVPRQGMMTPKALAQARKMTTRSLQTGDARIATAQTGRRTLRNAVGIGPESVAPFGGGARVRLNSNRWERFNSKTNKWSNVGTSGVERLEAAGVPKGFGDITSEGRPLPTLTARRGTKKKAQPIRRTRVSDPIPDFESGEDVSRWMRSQLELDTPIPEAAFRKMNKETLKGMMQRLQDYKAADLLPARMQFEFGDLSQHNFAAALRTPRNDLGRAPRLIMDWKVNLRQTRRAARDTVLQRAETGFNVSVRGANIGNYILDHEMGHALHYQRVGLRRWRNLGRAVRADLKSEIAKEVSRFAASKETEFVAEVWTGLVNGKRFSRPLMAYYEELGGVIPNANILHGLKKVAR